MRINKRNHRGGRRSASSSRAPPAALRTPHGARFAARPSVSGDVAVQARRQQAHRRTRGDAERRRFRCRRREGGRDAEEALRQFHAVLEDPDKAELRGGGETATRRTPGRARRRGADVTDILFPKKPAAGVGCLAERESAGVSRVRPIRTSTAVGLCPQPETAAEGSVLSRHIVEMHCRARFRIVETERQPRSDPAIN